MRVTLQNDYNKKNEYKTEEFVEKTLTRTHMQGGASKT
jgi:hypothetical protein